MCNLFILSKIQLNFFYFDATNFQTTRKQNKNEAHVCEGIHVTHRLVSQSLKQRSHIIWQCLDKVMGMTLNYYYYHPNI